MILLSSLRKNEIQFKVLLTNNQIMDGYTLYKSYNNNKDFCTKHTYLKAN
jgi:hypothetical protein